MSNTVTKKTKEKIIEHITKEIEVITNNIISFRLKNAFTVWIGPFILLGSLILSKNIHVDYDKIQDVIGLIATLPLLFIIMGVMGGLIEQQSWAQCEKLRRAISEITTRDDINSEELYSLISFNNLNRHALIAYTIVFILLLTIFVFITIITFNIISWEPQSNSIP